MIKVFLVEDEVVARNGIKNSIDWARAGMEFVGEASDGEIAFPMIKSTEPDILITDIKMPFMDGLELSRLVKQQMPNTKIIILSGYNEFDYAREAINIGITDYLLKPITAANLLKTICKVAEVIKEERQQRLYMEEFEEERRRHEQFARQSFFYQLVGGKTPAAALLEEARRFEMDLTAGCYNILLFHMFLNTADIGLYSEKENRLREALLEELQKKEAQMLLFPLENDVLAFVAKGNSEAEVDALIRETVEMMLAQIDAAGAQYGETWSYFGGVGKAVGRLSQMKTCFEDAGRMFALRYLKPANQICYAAEVQKEQPAESIRMASIDVGQLNKEIFLGFFRSGQKSEISVFVEEFFESLGEDALESAMFRQYVLMQIYFIAVETMEGLGFAAADLVKVCGDIDVISHSFSDKAAYMEYTEKVLTAVLDFRDRTTLQQEDTTLQLAAEFIKTHYNDENMSLNMVASYVNLSPNHFSTIFSQQMKRTFIEYLTGVRMEKARELLKLSNLRSAEIAYEVGYKDPHYFSYLFKKTHGITPREFRQRK